MEITVLLFASLKEAAGRDQVTISVPGPLAASELVEELGRQVPALSDLSPHVRVAVDQEFCGPDRTVSAGSEVALIPPVSGG